MRQIFAAGVPTSTISVALRFDLLACMRTETARLARLLPDASGPTRQVGTLHGRKPNQRCAQGAAVPLHQLHQGPKFAHQARHVFFQFLDFVISSPTTGATIMELPDGNFPKPLSFRQLHVSHEVTLMGSAAKCCRAAPHQRCDFTVRGHVPVFDE